MNINMEMPKSGASPIEKNTEPSEETKKFVEQVFKKYYKDLIRLCRYKLGRRKDLSHNPETDAEDVVAYLLERLLKDKNVSKLNDRPEDEVKRWLNVVLNNAIIRYGVEKSAKKRNPSGGFEPLESLENLGDFANNIHTEENRLWAASRIEQAIDMLKTRNPKMGTIMEEAYKKGKLDKEIAQEFGDAPSNISQLRIKAEKIIADIVTGEIKSILSIPKSWTHKVKRKTKD